MRFKMVTINVDKIVEIVSNLEASCKALDCIKAKLESTWPHPLVDEYYQILFALIRATEAKERLEELVEKRRIEEGKYTFLCHGK
jgi:hypothetical protein